MLVSNWRDVLRRAWSVRLLIVAGLLFAFRYAFKSFIAK